MDFVFAILSWAFMLSGAFFVVVGAIGIYRFPDFYSRLHGAGVTDTLGAELVLIGLIIQAGQAGMIFVSVKLALIAVFLFFTSPTATHAIANAAHVAGLKPFLSTFAHLGEPSSTDNEEDG